MLVSDISPVSNYYHRLVVLIIDMNGALRITFLHE